MEYLLVKWLHVLSSAILFGTGIGTAFYLLSATLSGDTRAAAAVTRHVVLADWLFTTPTIILQPLTGFYLMYLVGLPMASGWILWSLGLYAVAVACWLPVVWLQIRMKQLAREAAANDAPLPEGYWRYFRIWVALGIPALFAFIAIFYFMVVKPG
jgi:uncharacterized membrane protein